MIFARCEGTRNFFEVTNRSMKPRKKQRIETEENGIQESKKSKQEDKKKKTKKPERLIQEMEESSSEEEQLDEIIEDEDDLPGTLPSYSIQTIY